MSVLEAVRSGDVEAGVAAIVSSLVAAGLADWAGVTALEPDGSGFVTTGHTHELVRIIDAVQYRMMEGPCVHAATTREAVAADHLADDQRWPVWAPRAAQAGVAAVLSVPVHHGRTSLGALNLYRRDKHSYCHDDLERAVSAATHIAVLLGHVKIRHDLARAVDARTVIGQAQGVLMERFHLTADQAFAILRRYSQDSNTELHSIAEQLVATGSLPTTPPAPPLSEPADSPTDD